jgi:hypothetical protein
MERDTAIDIICLTYIVRSRAGDSYRTQDSVYGARTLAVFPGRAVGTELMYTQWNLHR